MLNHDYGIYQSQAIFDVYGEEKVEEGSLNLLTIAVFEKILMSSCSVNIHVCVQTKWYSCELTVASELRGPGTPNEWSDLR